jgi:hypothetical protein
MNSVLTQSESTSFDSVWLLFLYDVLYPLCPMSSARWHVSSTNMRIYEFYVHVTVHRNKFIFNKTNRRANFPNLFCQEILHVSGSSSAHHQEFSTVHSALFYVVQIWYQLSITTRMFSSILVVCILRPVSCVRLSSWPIQCHFVHSQINELFDVKKVDIQWH